ncbi:MAG TPA: AsnC family protein [Nodularia sp. (in: cyanobacteria)]|nr:AsnC family protein [Nodularia sp. (in: cyanobacteria)]
MNWLDFLGEEAGKRGLSPEQKETLLAALPQEDAQINHRELASDLSISEATVKSRLANIYKKFQVSCPELVQHQGAGKFEILRTYLKMNYYPAEQNLAVTNSVNLSAYSMINASNFNFLQGTKGKELISKMKLLLEVLAIK